MEAGVAFMLIWLVFAFFSCLISVGGTILWIWALVDCISHEPSEGNEKLVWIVVIVFTHWIGALIYLLVRRPKRIQEIGH